MKGSPLYYKECREDRELMLALTGMLIAGILTGFSFGMVYSTHSAAVQHSEDCR